MERGPLLGLDHKSAAEINVVHEMTECGADLKLHPGGVTICWWLVDGCQFALIEADLMHRLV